MGRDGLSHVTLERALLVTLVLLQVLSAIGVDTRGQKLTAFQDAVAETYVRKDVLDPQMQSMRDDVRRIANAVERLSPTP